MRNLSGPRTVISNESTRGNEEASPANGETQPTLWQIVAEDYVAHGREASRPGFQALLVYRLGVARMRVEPLLLRAPLSILYRAAFRTVRNFYGIELPYTAEIGRRVIFEHQHGIVVHGSTVIGDDCIIRQGVTLGIRHLDKLKEAPVLGKRVNVGAGAKILGRVQIGDDADIGANAVVLDDVPAGALAVGVPARVIEKKHKPSSPQLRVAPAGGERPASGERAAIR